MLQATGKHGRPLSRSYVNKMVDRIRRAFSWAVECEIIDSASYTAMKEVKGLQRGRTSAPEAERVKAVDDSVVEETLKHCSQVVGDMIRLQRMTGARPGEICNLTPAMIDRSGEVWMAKLQVNKGAWRGQDRTIYIGPASQAILLPYLLREVSSPIFSPKEADFERRERLRAQRKTPLNSGNKSGSNVVKTPKRSPGDAYTPMSYNRAIAYACDKVWPVPDGASREEAAAWRARYWWSPNLTATRSRN